MSTILIVEDEPIILENLKEIFQISGLEVMTALNGMVALKLLEEAKELGRLPSLILTDLNMPCLDGFGLLQAVKACDDYANIPVLVLSARSDPEDLRKAFLMGAADFLIKPFELDELMAMVIRQLGTSYQTDGGVSFELDG